MSRTAFVLLAAATVGAAAWAIAKPASSPTPPSGVLSRWETLRKADGLPSDRVFAVLSTPDGVWAGTEDGLAFVANGKVVRTVGTADGLSFPVVTSLCRDEQTGAVYAGTMRGVTKVERGPKGRITSIRQDPKGLANDVVYSVCVEGRTLWCATAAGLSRHEIDTGVWETFTEKNSPMKEIWCYSVAARDGKLFVGIWGSGVLERDLARGAWKLYQDPDRDMRFDLFRSDGLLSDVSVGVSYERGVLWVASYLGLTRYDGRDFSTYTKDDSGLASSFVNSVRANATECWSSTDKGLSQFDGRRWVTYRTAGAHGEIVVTPASGGDPARFETASAMPSDFVWSVDFDGRDVWVATSGGLARGIRNGPAPFELEGGARP